MNESIDNFFKLGGFRRKTRQLSLELNRISRVPVVHISSQTALNTGRIDHPRAWTENQHARNKPGDREKQGQGPVPKRLSGETLHHTDDSIAFPACQSELTSTAPDGKYLRYVSCRAGIGIYRGCRVL